MYRVLHRYRGRLGLCQSSVKVHEDEDEVVGLTDCLELKATFSTVHSMTMKARGESTMLPSTPHDR